MRITVRSHVRQRVGRSRAWAFALAFLLSGTRPAGAAVADGLVGHWTFDDGTGRDRSGAANDMILGQAQIYPLGEGRACLRIDPDGRNAEIPVKAGSPLAIERGTLCLWLNVGVKSSGTVLEFDNRAVQLLVYRSHFQPRFRGAESFR